MKIYLEGVLSTPQEDFYLDRLFFGDSESEDYETDFVSEKCLSLEGDCVDIFCKGNTFSARWKGVTTSVFKDGAVKQLYDGEISILEIIELLKNKKMVNGEACFSEDVECRITSLTIKQYLPQLGEIELKIDPSFLIYEIDFID